MSKNNFNRWATTGFLLVGLLLSFASQAQRRASRYAIEFLRGPGSYVLTDGTSGEADLQFKTRGESVLYINRKQQVPAAQVRSFTIGTHTLYPHGAFSFHYGFHSYEARNAFLEYADTTGSIQAAVYYTAEPTGDVTTYFTVLLLRARGSKTFIVGPDNDRKWRKHDREEIAPLFAQWPDLQKDILNGTATLENILGYVRRAK